LTYAEAQTRLGDERLLDELSVSLRTLNWLAREFRRRRTEAGALTLASPEVKFEMDSETQNPLDVGMYQVREVLTQILISQLFHVHLPLHL
jgi:exosome complex exonuclease DIS3/RRP44